MISGLVCQLVLAVEPGTCCYPEVVDEVIDGFC